MKREHTISIIVRNQAGVLTKVASIFYRHNYNIESITVGRMHTPGLSKILISVPVDERDVELLRRQIENLVDIKSVNLLDRNKSIMMEGCLIHLEYDSHSEMKEIMASAHPFQPRIRRIANRSITLEVVESPEIVNDFVSAMNKYRIFDISRTGMTAMGPDLPPAKRETLDKINNMAKDI
jgi:acetolactate synthase-1/3 small subunit